MKRFLSELLERHVPQIVGLYCAAMWGLVQFVDWLVEEFVLSPHLPGFVFLLGLLLVPSVGLLTWRLGSDGNIGSDENLNGLPLNFGAAGRLEASGIILNLIAAAFVLSFSYGDEGLGSPVREVRLVDEVGDTVKVQVPKEEFVRELVLFHFDNETGSSSLDWISYATTHALDWDLRQDPFVNAVPQWSAWYGFQQHLTESGYPSGTGVPLAMKLDLAERRQGVEHFLTGSFSGDETLLTVRTRLYETATGRMIAKAEFHGPSLFSIVDDISEQIRRDLGVPDYRLNTSPDLPIEEILTGSSEALRLAALSRHMGARGENDSALVLLEKAVSEDSTFASALESLAYDYLYLGQKSEADSIMRQAFRYLYRMPEQEQLIARLLRYREFDEDFEGALVTAQHMAQLYPRDIRGLSALRSLYGSSGDLPRMIETADRILEIDPSQHIQNFFVGNRLLQAGQNERALARLLRYVEAVPDQPDGYIWLSWAYRALGKHDSAAAVVKRAEALGNQEAWTYLTAAWLALDLGKISQADEYRAKASDVAYESGDQWLLYRFDDSYFVRLGRLSEAIGAYFDMAEVVREWGAWSAAQLLSDTELMDHAPLADHGSWALGQLDSLSASIDESQAVQLAGSYVQLHLALGDTTAARSSLRRVLEAESLYPHKSNKYHLAYGRGRFAEINGRCKTAIDEYSRALSLFSEKRLALLGKVRCERAIGDTQAAEGTLSGWLRRVPSEPYALLQLAELYVDVARYDDADSALEKVLDLWRDADPEFVPAQNARELRRKLSTLRDP